MFSVRVIEAHLVVKYGPPNVYFVFEKQRCWPLVFYLYALITVHQEE